MHMQNACPPKVRAAYDKSGDACAEVDGAKLVEKAARYMRDMQDAVDETNRHVYAPADDAERCGRRVRR